MLELSHETETLARRVAVVLGRKPDDLIRSILEREERALAAQEQTRGRRRMTAEEMLAVGREISQMPLLDRRSPKEISDELSHL